MKRFLPSFTFVRKPVAPEMDGHPNIPRAILHVDMDAFFASIAQRDHPELRGKPVLTGGTGPRGVVTTASYEARPFGCRSAMPMAQARRLCPQAVCVKVRGTSIREASLQVREVMHRYTDLVQPLSCDEAFLDVTGSVRLFGDPISMGESIRREIFEITGGLTASVGVASNKFLAKLASDLNKPDGMTVITAENLRATLDPLPVSRLWGVGPATQTKLHAIGIKTFGDIRRAPVDQLVARFGTWGERLHELAHGRDERVVTPDRSAKSIGQEQTFAENLSDPQAVRDVLLSQCEHVAWRLRAAKFAAGGVAIKVRDGSFYTVSRSATLDEASDRTADLWNTVSGLFDTWSGQQFVPVRLIGCTLERLVARDGVPERLFTDPQEVKQTGVDRAMDAIVNKFGSGAVHRGTGGR